MNPDMHSSDTVQPRLWLMLVQFTAGARLEPQSGTSTGLTGLTGDS